MKRDEVEKQNKISKDSERTNRRSKIVAATVDNDVVEDNNTQETYMMCKEVRLINPEEPEKTTNALVFFDTRSGCNYITESMVNKVELKPTSPSVGMLITGLVGTKKYKSRKTAFGVQTLHGKKNFVDSILERVPYLINHDSEKLEGGWGKPDVLLDASQRAVGLAVYSSRSNSTPGESKLIYGKTRLVPKRESRNKSASIPKLELLAVTIGVRVLEFIKQEIYVEKTYLWTDSACVLHWLRKPPLGSKYISNRIGEIKRSKDIEFRHVRSACNPADLTSRGLLPEKLIESSLWWNGPSWLSKPKERWPEYEIMEENIMSVCLAMGLMEEETIQSE
uniref:Uncharacterized protein n=1 Tax=Wuchereria bancrofti TaxID=6293 RepID=A0AAF5Q710_WUCBA